VQVFVASLEQCLRAKNWPAALCLALTLPEMAGAVDSPKALRRKDTHSGSINGWALSIEHVFCRGNRHCSPGSTAMP